MNHSAPIPTREPREVLVSGVLFRVSDNLYGHLERFTWVHRDNQGRLHIWNVDPNLFQTVVIYDETYELPPLDDVQPLYALATQLQLSTLVAYLDSVKANAPKRNSMRSMAKNLRIPSFRKKKTTDEQQERQQQQQPSPQGQKGLRLSFRRSKSDKHYQQQQYEQQPSQELYQYDQQPSQELYQYDQQPMQEAYQYEQQQQQTSQGQKGLRLSFRKKKTDVHYQQQQYEQPQQQPQEPLEGIHKGSSQEENQFQRANSYSLGRLRGALPRADSIGKLMQSSSESFGKIKKVLPRGGGLQRAESTGRIIGKKRNKHTDVVPDPNEAWRGRSYSSGMVLYENSTAEFSIM